MTNSNKLLRSSIAVLRVELQQLRLLRHEMHRTNVSAEPVVAHEALHTSTISMRTASWSMYPEIIGVSAC